MWRKIRWIALSFTVVLVGVVGYYGYHLVQFSNHIQKKDGDSIFTQFNPTHTSAEQPAPPKWEGKERVNIMLLGGDSRGLSKNEIPRSDSNMVISVDPVTKKAHLFSILRDTYVKIPGFGSDRINAAITLGGPQLAMQTAGDLLGLKIQYFVYTDFQGFMALVDALDGIDLDVEKDMKYKDSEEPEFDIDLKKGLQHLDGKTALQYVRFRHDAMSDFTRTERQRKFMTAVADKMQSTTSIFKLPSILSSIDPYIETNISFGDMIKLGSLGFDVKAAGVKGVQVPPMDLLEEDNIGGASVLTVNRDKLQKFVKDEFAGLHDPDTDNANGAVSGSEAESANGDDEDDSDSGSSTGGGSSGSSSGSSSGTKSNTGSSANTGGKSGSGNTGTSTGSGSTGSGTKTGGGTTGGSGKPTPTPAGGGAGQTGGPGGAGTPASTPPATFTPTPTPSQKPTPTPTPRPTPTPASTSTSTPMSTPPPSATLKPASTPTPGSTSTPGTTPGSTSTPGSTVNPAQPASPTPKPTSTATPRTL